MNKKVAKRKKKINFLLENDHYRRLQLILYFLSIFVIILFYFLVVFFFSAYSPSYILTGVFSVMIGVYLVYNRDEIVKKMDDRIQKKKRKSYKKANKDGLKTTLRKITPKRSKVKLNIKDKTPFKEKLKKFKTKKPVKTKEYIEIK